MADFKTIKHSESLDDLMGNSMPDAFSQDLQQVIYDKVEEILTEKGISTDDILDYTSEIIVNITIKYDKE